MAQRIEAKESVPKKKDPTVEAFFQAIGIKGVKKKKLVKAIEDCYRPLDPRM